MNTVVTINRRYTGRPTPGRQYEFRAGYLLRAIPTRRREKFHASIICPNVWNETTYGGWDTETDALSWMREQVDDVLPRIPTLLREANRIKFANICGAGIAPCVKQAGEQQGRGT